MRRLVTGICAIVAVLAAALTPLAPPSAHALSGSAFNAGYIISDERFFDSDAMSESAIQAFLNAQMPACRGANGYTCLRTSQFDTYSRGASGRCSAYSGANGEYAARVISKVALACGINPQVLLVMLQKEQALITAASPTERQYRVAMGYGCPDTAPCDAQFYGFYNQVYKAAWQLRQYGVNASSWRYHVGNVAVQYSPAAACGSRVVNILNQATADLYNYTPYQPNAAALANLGGSGDSCSSYGNRNFWVYFNNWFGSPTGPDGRPYLALEYARLGGADGPLGPSASDVMVIPEWGGGLGEAYQHGSLYWTWSGGAHAVYEGPIRDYYFARSGASGNLGWPLSDRTDVAAGVTGSSGIAQAFSFGSVYSSAKGTFLVSGTTRDGYFLMAGAAGDLGWPTAEVSCASEGCVQTFEGGHVYSRASGGYPLPSWIDTPFRSAGGVTGSWGWPLSAPQQLSANGGGWAQAFANLSIYTTDRTHLYAVSGGIRDYYFLKGGSTGLLGWPTDPVTCSSSDHCSQAFQGGVITQSGSTYRVSQPRIDAAYNSAGGSRVLGAAVSEPIKIYGYSNEDGWGQVYASGSIFVADGATTAYAVTGAIRDAYFARGGASGMLGWPTGAAICGSGTCTQAFQGGVITQSASGLKVSKPEFDAAYAAAGGSAVLGTQQSEPIRAFGNGGGWGQAYSKGSIYLAAGSSTAYPVAGAVRTAYFASGGSDGALGWPTALAACSGSICQQTFGSGLIVSSPSGAFSTSGSIAAAYTAAGGTSGGWGVPISSVLNVRGGTAQAFAAVSAYAATGAPAFPVAGTIRTWYFSKGGADSSIGLPSEAASCSASVCTQRFQNGAVISSTTVTHGTTPNLLTGFLAAQSGPTPWGMPVSEPGAISTATATGVGQMFANVSVYQRPGLADFPVAGRIRDAYFARGGATGMLGWPTGALQCASGSCTQSFEYGTIVDNGSTATVR